MTRWIHGPRPLSLAILLAAALAVGACLPEGPATAPPERGTVVPDRAPTRAPPIPATRRTPEATPTAQPTMAQPTVQPLRPSSSGAATTRIYTVQPGDVCWRIAQDHGVKTLALLEANPRINANCTNLRVGWELVIP